MGVETNPSSASVECGDVATGARLLIHLKENNVQYLLVTILAYQLGFLDKMFAYGTGVCG